MEPYLFDFIEGPLIGDVIDQHEPLQTGSDISTASSGCYDGVQMNGHMTEASEGAGLTMAPL